MTSLYIAAAGLYLLLGCALAGYGVSQGEPFSLRTVVAWPLVLVGR